MIKLRSMLAASVFATVAITSSVTEAKAQNREVWLYTGQSTIVSGNFVGGEVIYGTCDNDCYDLDLFLYDAQGQQINQDVANDATPILVAPYDGYFEIGVAMPNCNADACAAWVSSDYGF